MIDFFGAISTLLKSVPNKPKRHLLPWLGHGSSPTSRRRRSGPVSPFYHTMPPISFPVFFLCSSQPTRTRKNGQTRHHLRPNAVFFLAWDLYTSRVFMGGRLFLASLPYLLSKRNAIALDRRERIPERIRQGHRPQGVQTRSPDTDATVNSST